MNVLENNISNKHVPLNVYKLYANILRVSRPKIATKTPGYFSVKLHGAFFTMCTIINTSAFKIMSQILEKNYGIHIVTVNKYSYC